MRVKNANWLLLVVILGLITVFWCMAMVIVEVSYGADVSEETLTLKRDLLAERAVRIQSQMQVLQQQYAILQVDLERTRKALDIAQKELDSKFPSVKKETK